MIASVASLPRWGPWIALASVIAVALASLEAWPRLERWRGEREAVEALAALRGCLGGAVDDTALRARAIAADLAEDGWPAGCARHAAEAELALARAERVAARCEGRCCLADEGCAAIARRRHQLATLRAQMTARRFEDGVAIALLGFPPTSASAPPAPRLPPPPAPLVGYAFDSSALVDTSLGPTLLLHRRAKRADTCVVDLDRARARCTMVDAAVPVGDAVLAVDGAPEAPLHVLARDAAIAPERWGLYRGDGALVVHVDGRTPFGASPEQVLVRDRHGYGLIGPSGDRAAVESEAPPLLHGRDLFRVVDGVLVGGTIRAALPDLDAETLALEACRGDDTVVLAVVDDGASAVRAAVAFPGEGLAHAIRPGVRWFGFTCAGDAASVTWIEEIGSELAGGRLRGEYGIHRIVCRRHGCGREHATIPLERHHRGSRYLVAAVGDDVVIVWRSGAGDVRYRRAPLDRLATAPQHALFDDVEPAEGRRLDWEGSAELLALGSGAILLVAGAEATHGWVLAPGGPRALAPR